VVKLFEQFVREELNEKMGLSSEAKEAGDELAASFQKGLSTKANYEKILPGPGQEMGSMESYTFYFTPEEENLRKHYGADGINMTLTYNVGPTLFGNDVMSSGRTYDTPAVTTKGKIVLVSMIMSIDPEVYAKNFKRGVESAMTELRAVLYHELTHAGEFEKRRANEAPVMASAERVRLGGSKELENTLRNAFPHDDMPMPYFFTRFFQLMYISTSYEVNAFAAMVVADLEKYPFKKREDFESMKDFVVSNHETIEKRKAELIKTNSWRNYIKLKEFSIADFIIQLEKFGLSFEKFFKALTAANSSKAALIKRSIAGDPNLSSEEKTGISKIMDETLSQFKSESENYDPIDTMRKVAKRIDDAKHKLQRKLARMITYE